MRILLDSMPISSSRWFYKLHLMLNRFWHCFYWYLSPTAWSAVQAAQAQRASWQCSQEVRIIKYESIAFWVIYYASNSSWCVINIHSIERYAKTAFVSLYRTCYLAGIMILPPLSRDRFTNTAKSPHLRLHKFEEQRYGDMFGAPANVCT